MKAMRTTIAPGLTILAFMAALGQAPAQQPSLPPPLFAEAVAPAGDAGRRPPATNRMRFVDVNSDLLADDAVLVNLFDDASFLAVLDRRIDKPSGDVLWLGHIDGVVGSTVNLATRDGVVVGTFRWLGAMYELRGTGAGTHIIREINVSQLPAHLDPKPVGRPDPLTEGETLTEPVATADAGDVIDLMVVYTPASAANNGGAASLEAMIELAVADANQAYKNSWINVQLNLVHMAQVAYNEGTMRDSLYDLTYIDGIIDEVHDWRDAYGADQVSMIAEDTQYCGIAYVMQTESASFAPYAFSVVNSLCLWRHTLTHELGHNQGSMHDRAHSSIEGVFEYSYGYQFAPWYTVMSYSCGGCTRIDHLSNPYVQYDSVPTGVPAGDPESADNALSINNTRDTVANFRQSAPLDPPAAPTGLAAAVAAYVAIELTWTNNATNQAGFEIERSSDKTPWGWLTDVGAGAESYTDTGLDPVTRYYYQVRAYNAAGTSDWSNTAEATTPTAPPFVEDVAIGEIPVAGFIAGTYQDTATDDGLAQAIAERESGGKKSNRYSYLEHIWVFDVTGGSAVTFYLNATTRQSSDGDVFDFAYSTDDVNYTYMVKVDNETDDGTYRMYALPATTFGTVYVRVTDSNHQVGYLSPDSVSVDHMYIRSQIVIGGERPAAPNGLIAPTILASQIDLVWADNSTDEYGFAIERSENGGAWETVTTTAVDIVTYSDTALMPSTQYDYRVAAFNGAGMSDYSNVVSATTDEGIVLNAFGRKYRGENLVQLDWYGAATGTNRNIYRDGNLILTTILDNYRDLTGTKGEITFTYKVCDVVGGIDNTCSDPPVQVTF